MKDLVSLQEVVRDQVRQTVLAAIPKDTIDNIVKDYFENEFKLFVKKELEVVLKDKFKSAILSEGEAHWHRDGHPQVSNVSREVAESIMQGFATSIIHSVVSNMKNSVDSFR